MKERLQAMLTLPGMDRPVTAEFSNGMRPGEVTTRVADDVASALALLAEQQWYWPPDESSNEALPIDPEILADHLRSGDAAYLMVPTTADLVLLRPRA